MEARVKATGEIINVKEVIQYDSNFKSSVYYKAENGFPYKKEHLDFEDLTQGKADVKEKSLPKDEPDYWEKLKHQYARIAMQGIINNDRLLTFLCEENNETTISDTITSYAIIMATKLVNKLKEKTQCEK